MIVVFLFLGALALLVTLLLFGFVGCSLDTMGELTRRDYSAAYRDTPGLVSYWRLGDSTPVPSATGAAVDEVGGNNGTYLTLPPPRRQTPSLLACQLPGWAPPEKRQGFSEYIQAIRASQHERGRGLRAGAV